MRLSEKSLERERSPVVLLMVVINAVAVALLIPVPWPDWKADLGLNLRRSGIGTALMAGPAPGSQFLLLRPFPLV